VVPTVLHRSKAYPIDTSLGVGARACHSVAPPLRMQSVTACRSVLQRVTVCCSVLQRVAVCCSVSPGSVFRPRSSAAYAVATISRLLKIISLFCRISSLYRSLLQKRPIILRSLLIEATACMNGMRSLIQVIVCA